MTAFDTPASALPRSAAVLDSGVFSRACTPTGQIVASRDASAWVDSGRRRPRVEPPPHEGDIESAGHRVVCASDGAQAIDLAISTQPDMILLDVKMPGMDGFEVCAKLQSLAETATIPIMFVTAHYAEEQDMLHGLGIGAYDYLIKPVSRAVLLARIGVSCAFAAPRNAAASCR